ncbi:interleukin-12 subunit beta [Salmo trutta]|uniref:Interleukin-12 subunit beta n=1 Tax=Salmo trutta TaxID=8032 RepID=A0A673XXH9_SALTR|nr:interleukin-12 subunit beta-like [Salmo trutta]
MIMLLLNVLYLILHMASSSQHETIVPLMPNVLVVKVDRKVFTETQVPLRCGDYQDTEVIWWNGEERLENKGNQINVTVVEMMGGNYSCHNPAGDYLNHTLVLVQDIPSPNRTRRVLEKSHDTDKDEYIRCLAKNYSGIFHCSWKKTEYRMSAAAVFVQVGRTISCSVDSDGEGLTCQDRESCPFAEELSRIHLTVYFRTNYLLEDYTITPFYIQEIVKPDKIDITKVEGNTFQWGYPATWSRPCSYFPLTFRVKVVQHEASCDSKEKVFISETNINATEFTVRSSYKKYCFCLGAKDDLVDSQWSQWTRHEVKNKSKKH